MALKAALKRLTKRCSALVFTKCEYVLSSYKNEWISEWKKNDWTNARGVKLSNWELWRDIWELSTMHELSFESVDVKNPYEMWITDNIKKVENEK